LRGNLQGISQLQQTNIGLLQHFQTRRFQGTSHVQQTSHLRGTTHCQRPNNLPGTSRSQEPANLNQPPSRSQPQSGTSEPQPTAFRTPAAVRNQQTPRDPANLNHPNPSQNQPASGDQHLPGHQPFSGASGCQGINRMTCTPAIQHAGLARTGHLSICCHACPGNLHSRPDHQPPSAQPHSPRQASQTPSHTPFSSSIYSRLLLLIALSLHDGVGCAVSAS
jgi:hypothetical protein